MLTWLQIAGQFLTSGVSRFQYRRDGDDLVKPCLPKVNVTELQVIQKAFLTFEGSPGAICFTIVSSLQAFGAISSQLHWYECKKITLLAA